MNQDLVIKLSFEGKIKRISIEKDHNYESFLSLIRENYKDQQTSKFTLNYIDNEHDTVWIENQQDFSNAIAFSGKLNTILRIYIEKKEDFLFKERKYSTTKLVIASPLIEEELTTLVSLKCESCSRVFNNRKSFNAHTSVCKKVFMTKRTKFDSHIMRMRGIALFNKITLLHLHTLYTLRKEFPVKYESKRRECFNCHRLFTLSAFEVHMKMCENLKTKRPTFDSKKQRMICTNEIIVKKSNEYYELKKKKNKSELAKWKKDSLRFRNIMKISRMLLRHC